MADPVSEILLEGMGQLSLDLFPGQPWQGRTARALTRVGLGLSFEPRGGRARVSLDPLQYDFFPRRRQRLKRQSRTAPTLLPLPF